MERRLERELMDDPLQAAAYARADFRVSNQSFVDVLARASTRGWHRVVDLGCGPGDVAIRIARALPHVHVTAVDGSAPMAAIALDAVRRAGLDDRVSVLWARLPDLDLPAGSFDAVLSKDLLHHLPDPRALWHEIARLGRTGAYVQVMDLMRPATAGDARRIVEAAAGEADAILQTDFFNSLCAAFTVEELRDQAAAIGWAVSVEAFSDRHLLLSGRLPES